MKSIVSDDELLQVPFPPLYGEYVQFLGRTSDGVIALSNFRLLIRQKKSFVNIPLGLIDLVDTREIFYLTLYCKDGTTYRYCYFAEHLLCIVVLANSSVFICVQIFIVYHST